jgi:hypothetical protein
MPAWKMRNPVLDFKIQCGISQIQPWFLNSCVGNDKFRLGFQNPAVDFTNPVLDFGIPHGGLRALARIPV